MVEVLLKAGATPDHDDRETGMPALMSAAWFEHVSAARVLVAGGADCGPRSTFGATALESARDKKNPALVKKTLGKCMRDSLDEL